MLFERLVSGPALDIGYVRRINPQKARKYGVWHTVSQCGSHIFHITFCQLELPVLVYAFMARVLPRGYDLEILWSVIRPVSVYMVDLSVIGRRFSKKRGRHELMNSDSATSPMLGYGHRGVSRPHRVRRKHFCRANARSSFAAHLSGHAADIAHSGRLIQSFVFRNVFPFFHRCVL